MIIDRTKVSGDHRDFPVLIALKDADLRSAASGGHVARPQGEDICFTLSDGTTKLCHEMESYDPATGALRAWVRVPALSSTADTPLYLYYGNPAGHAGQEGHRVWDAGYKMVLHLHPAEGPQRDSTANQNHGTSQRGEGQGVCTRIGPSASLSLTDAITVEAWVESGAFQAEALQAAVSRWSLLKTLNTFDAYDAGDTDGLNTKGFFGAVFDGRYVYFVPQNDGDHKHGRVLRYDTHGPFGDAKSWSAYDAGNTAGLSTKGYYGAVAAGRYVYFVPRTDDAGAHTRLLRHDSAGEFRAPGSWQAFDVGNAISYQSAAYDGRYIYFSPGYEQGSGPTGKVMRYDTQAALNDPNGYVVHDAGNTSGLNAKCYDGAVFDGRYVYFAPLNAEGIVLRCDTRGDFSAPAAWSAYDASRTSGLKMGQCVGAIFDGRYIYYVPYANSVAVRYDTRGDFLDSRSWSAYDAGNTSGLKTTGYDGAAFDGKYVYFIPFWEGESTYTGFHGKLLRYDTQGEFTSGESWTAFDAGDTGGIRPVGFNGGAFDGRFIYFAPWRQGTDPDGKPQAHGRVLRYDTTGPNASFSLRVMDCGHNGGLCAALPGPSFLVNTDRGVLNARVDRTLKPGARHLTGTYDGKCIRLFIDGELVSEQEGAGRILTSDADVTVGRIQDGRGHFNGRISVVRVSGVARSADWIRTGHANQRSPSEFIGVGKEEKVQS
jgi:hypothetical protein